MAKKEPDMVTVSRVCDRATCTRPAVAGDPLCYQHRARANRDFCKYLVTLPVDDDAPIPAGDLIGWDAADGPDDDDLS